MTSSATSLASFTRSRPMGSRHRELRDYVERIRTQILTIKNAAKAQLIGAQDQKFYLEFDTHQLAGLGVSRDQVISSLQEQNAVTPSGVVQTGLEKFAIRVSGAFNSVDDLKRINLYANGKFFRLADVASIKQRLCRSAAADVPVQRRAGDRTGHLDGAGRQQPRLRRGCGAQDGSRSSPSCRSASRRISSPTSRWSSRRRLAASPRRCGKQSQSCLRSAL